MMSRVKIVREGYKRRGGRTRDVQISVDNERRVSASLAKECRFQSPSVKLIWDPVMVKEASGSGMGNGLFAVKMIKKQCEVIRYTGVIYSDKKIQDELQESYRNEGIVGDYMIETEKYLIDATKQGSDARFANHSCNPNCEFVEDNNDSKIVHLLTLKDVNKGEEITVNYKISTDKNDLVPCRCTEPDCRGIKNEPDD